MINEWFAAFIYNWTLMKIDISCVSLSRLQQSPRPSTGQAEQVHKTVHDTILYSLTSSPLLLTGIITVSTLPWCCVSPSPNSPSVSFYRSTISKPWCCTEPGFWQIQCALLQHLLMLFFFFYNLPYCLFLFLLLSISLSCCLFFLYPTSFQQVVPNLYAWSCSKFFHVKREFFLAIVCSIRLHSQKLRCELSSDICGRNALAEVSLSSPIFHYHTLCQKQWTTSLRGRGFRALLRLK